ncbi:uncharacterized protein MYCGRDRAFT_44609 [Zymoseptoria tritici IPO323]|uniref:HypA-like protein n=1 Tax=Zymoseptoria tritici (strain CBS 115943 / IPO323) TaxID=336722 RepID=F9XF07_ZYMTI|nr:uncharacterized protein MYCGRDRAFT_44609 [Zymoseptoria tritici IPO323]EGP85601.1 hypothetical protein MYCGRDRAFT_44609 [Zymoseptoria tritici IPO323]
MATASTVQLQASQKPAYYKSGITSETSKRASELLQENHERHHIFFNHEGFHNHIVHHLLTLWSLGAGTADIQKGYDDNQSYQRPAITPKSSIVGQLQDVDTFMQHLGPEKHYPDFLEFFKHEIEAKGWQETLRQYVFAGDQRADDMLVRMYSGFLHPIIHLGFGIEFQQPAIIAEALAQAACHDNWLGQLLLPAEKVAASRAGGTSKSIVQLIDEIHADKQIIDAVRWEDGNKIRDGLLARAGDRMIDYLSQVKVKPDDLELKIAEMTNACIYYTGGAQRTDKAVKFDFFYMHSVNSSIFWSSFLKQDWLSEVNKVRLLEWKIRLDLAMYASRRSPEVRLDLIRDYKPCKPSGWDEIQARVCALPDDGHASKLVRAIAHGEQICEPYEESDAFRVRGSDWLQLGHMIIDSVEAPGETWVRSTGFDEAWKHVPLRSQL